MSLRSIEIVFIGTVLLTGIMALIATLTVTSSGSAEDLPDRFFTPKPVTIDELKKFIAEQKGKVLILDLWSDTCTICKEEFPRLVKLHEKHAKDGLVAASLCLDRPTNEKAERPAVLDGTEGTLSQFRHQRGTRRVAGAPGH
jgi:thiol-disulfide isomerase/thioredoxin